MKDDLISRSWLLDVFEHFVPWDTEKDRNRAIHHVRELAPSAQPERIKGHWIDAVIPNDSGGLPVIVCDKCHTFFPLQFGDGHNFCPHCGADMRGEELDETD